MIMRGWLVHAERSSSSDVECAFPFFQSKLYQKEVPQYVNIIKELVNQACEATDGGRECVFCSTV